MPDFLTYMSTQASCSFANLCLVVSENVLTDMLINRLKESESKLNLDLNLNLNLKLNLKLNLNLNHKSEPESRKLERHQ